MFGRAPWRRDKAPETKPTDPEEKSAYDLQREAEEARVIFDAMDRRLGRRRGIPPRTDSEYDVLSFGFGYDPSRW